MPTYLDRKPAAARRRDHKHVALICPPPRQTLLGAAAPGATPGWHANAWQYEQRVPRRMLGGALTPAPETTTGGNVYAKFEGVGILDQHQITSSFDAKTSCLE